MISIGERLKRQRLQGGMTLEQVAGQIKIPVRFLEAMESEQFEQLPSGVFRKSFVLQYARALGLDTDSLAGELRQLRAFDQVIYIPGEELPRFGSDMPTIAPSHDWSGLRNSVSSLIGVVLVIFACASVYTWWQNETQSDPSMRVDAPDRVVRELPPVAPPPIAQPPAAEVAVASVAVPVPVPVTPSSVPPSSGPLASGTVRVGLTAGEDTWIQVSSDGKRVFSDELPAKETKVIEGSEKVRVLVGNAGGVDISLNGKPIGAIGAKGQVRVVELTPSGFQIVPRNPPIPDPL